MCYNIVTGQAANKEKGENKMKKSIAAMEIIAEELGMPTDASFGEILAAMSIVDVDGEIKELLIKACKQDLLEMFKKEGLIAE